MSIIKKYNFDKTLVTAIEFDNRGFLYVWIAFKKDSNGKVYLRKVSANNLNQLYYEIEVDCDEITDLEINSVYLYVSVNDTTNIGYRYFLDNPLGTYITVPIPSGVSEVPIETHLNATESLWWILTPGIISGEIAKLSKFDLLGVFDETIELTKSGEEIQNAKSFTIDDNNEIWVVTNEAPSKLIRVYQDSGGLYIFDSYNFGV